MRIFCEECEPSEMLLRALRFLDDAQAKKNRKVLVHCVSGLNRSAFVCAAYLILRCNIDLMEALETVFVARKHQDCLLNSVFRKQLIVLSHHAGRLDWGEQGVPASLPRSRFRERSSGVYQEVDDSCYGSLKRAS